MRNYEQSCIDGHWGEPVGKRIFEAVSSATEDVAERIRFGEQEDVDRAVAAAR